MKAFLPAMILTAVLFACTVTVPFNLPGAIDPTAVVAGYRDQIPERFHLLSSIVFEYNWFTVSGIGYLDLNTRDGSYKVSCMNHLGVRLFEFSGDRSGLQSQYAIEPLAKHGNIAVAVSEDIKRIYLDMMPAPDARFIEGKHSVLSRQRAGEGALEYEFSGEGMRLARKTYREDHRAVWRVSYDEYREKDGKSYPMVVVFTNYRYGYRLIVRQREILD
jgi:hypothetical protein